MKSSQENAIITFPSDHRKYKYLKLDNGLSVLLVENNRAQMAQAIMRVGFGSFHEPNEFPGLAHFLEHMLFLGTKKFPEAGEYQSFITNNSGSYNAVTEERHTQYHFDIELNKFKDALDRFSQFFISPLFNSDCAVRELQAVNNEFMDTLVVDGRRFDQIDKLMANRKHPYSRFSSGNQETLREDELEQILQQLKFHYRQYYKANHMTLVLTSHHSLQELENFAKTFFSQIPNASIGLPNTFKEKRIVESSLGHTAYIESKEESRRLLVRFYINQNQSIESEMARRYIVYMLANTSEGSLSDRIKEAGWIEFDSSAEVYFNDKRQIEFRLTFSLTETGLLFIDEITSMTLNYINFIKKEGVKLEFFNIIKASDQRGLNYEANLINDGFTFLHNLQLYPVEYAFVGQRLLESTPFPDKMVKTILEQLTHKSMQRVVFDKNLDDHFNTMTRIVFTKEQLSMLDIFPEHIIQLILDNISDPNHVEELPTEHYSSALYKIVPFTQEQLNTWSETPQLDFALPTKNPYLPTDFSSKKISGKYNHPTLILNDNRLRVWFSEDFHFNKPRAFTTCLFLSKIISDTALNCVHGEFYQFLLENEINKKMLRHLESAGTSWSTDDISRGFTVSVNGYSHKHVDILLKIIDIMSSFIPDSNSITETQNVFRHAILMSSKENILEQCGDYLEVLIDRFGYEKEEMLEVLEKVNADSMKQYIESFISGLKLELYTHGNLWPQEVIELGKTILKKLNVQSSNIDPIQQSIIHLPPASSFQYLFKTELENNAVMLFLQAPDNSTETSCLLALLQSIIHPSCFHQLRTVEQLAYNVSCSEFYYINTRGLKFCIESTSYNASYLLGKLESFISCFIKECSNISEDMFQSYKQSRIEIVNSIMKSPSSPSEYAGFFLSRLTSGKYHFDETFKLVETMSKITLKKLNAFYQELVSPKTRRQLVIKTEDGEENLENATLINDIDAFKETIPYFPDPTEEGEKHIQGLVKSTQEMTQLSQQTNLRSIEQSQFDYSSNHTNEVDEKKQNKIFTFSKKEESKEEKRVVKKTNKSSL